METATTSKRPSRRIRDPQVPRKLVAAAAKVVAEHGVGGATVRAIASEAGVSTGSITHYFASKDELVAAVLTLTNERAGARVLRAIEGERGLGAVIAALNAVLPLDTRRRRDWRVWVALWASAEPEAARGLRTAWAALREIITPHLGDAADQGEIRPDLDLEYEADRLVTIVAGLGLATGVEPRGRMRDRSAQAIADHLASIAGTGQPRLGSDGRSG